ncbi:MAG: hypothetical protein ACE5IR_01665 [bacterium]
MIRKFKAPSIKAAMQMVKDELGKEAVILQTKKIPAPNSLRPEAVEIHAMIAEGEPVDSKIRRLYSPSSIQRPKDPNYWAAQIKEELESLKQAVINIPNERFPVGAILSSEPFHMLIRTKGLDEDVAADLARKIDFSPESRISGYDEHALWDAISNYFRVDGQLQIPQDRPKIIYLVGPTGVGKTTTTVKLATNPDFYGKRRVALITIDTYRVAAAAQLKMFATLSQRPLEIAYTPAEYERALQRFKDYEVILVDTAGRSPYNSEHIEKLQSFIDIRRPDEIHLVLSVSIRPDNSLDAAKSFGALPVNRLIFSKLDETPRIGNILNVAKKINLPISFLTNGQNIPDDILIASNKFIANAILE